MVGRAVAVVEEARRGARVDAVELLEAIEAVHDALIERRRHGLGGRRYGGARRVRQAGRGSQGAIRFMHESISAGLVNAPSTPRGRTACRPRGDRPAAAEPADGKYSCWPRLGAASAR